jgi:anti-sigma B factor antagonist
MRRTTTLNNERSGTGRARRSDRQDLQITTADDGSLVVAGDLDAATADMMDRALRDAEAARQQRTPIVVDLRGVVFMDSSGLRTLVAASLRAGRRGTRVALRNVGPELSRLLEITGLRDQFGLTAAGPVDRAWQNSDAHVPRDDHPDRRRG